MYNWDRMKNIVRLVSGEIDRWTYEDLHCFALDRLAEEYYRHLTDEEIRAKLIKLESERAAFSEFTSGEDK